MPAPLVAFPRDDLPFPGSLHEFQQLFPNDAACASYLAAFVSGLRERVGVGCK